jgi:hypothetical protein
MNTALSLGERGGTALRPRAPAGSFALRGSRLQAAGRAAVGDGQFEKSPISPPWPVICPINCELDNALDAGDDIIQALYSEWFDAKPMIEAGDVKRGFS